MLSTGKVSAVILTRNEEAMLPGCLAGLGWADEILVLDSGSTDKTCEIAEAAGAKVFRRDFDNFSNQFNHGIEMAAGPWIFMNDADEVVDAQLGQSLRRLLDGKPDLEVYDVVRDSFFLGKRMRATSWSGEKVPRLFRKGSLIYKGLVHPVTDTGERRIGLVRDGRLLHYTYRSMEQYFDKMRLYSTLWAQNAHQNGKQTTLFKMFSGSAWRFFHNYLFRGEFLDGRMGLLTSALSSIYTFVKYARLWDLNRGGKRKP